MLQSRKEIDNKKGVITKKQVMHQGNEQSRHLEKQLELEQMK